MSLTKHPLPALGMPCIAAVVLLLHGCDMPTEATATDPCASVECGADQVCSSGACYDVADPCDLTKCAEGQYCSNGACYDVALRPDPACLGVRCPDGFACVAGECYEVADSCAFTECLPGQVCVNGICYDEESPCAGVTCEANEYCYNGTCYPDGPGAADDVARADTECDENEACYQGACYPLVVTAESRPLSLVVAAGAFAFALHEDKVEGTLLDEEGVIGEELVMDAPVR